MIRTGSPGATQVCAWPLALVLSLAILSLATPALRAQTSATVRGIVTDTSGAAVGGAEVSVVSGAREIARVRSSPDGRYTLAVPPGIPFEVRVRREGFADAVAAVPGASGAVTRDIVLAVGAISDRLVVTAARSPQSRASLTTSVSVVDAVEIERSGAASLADAIRTVPGLHVESNGREGALTSLFARGAESDHNLVLIDGVRVNQSGGAFDLSRVSAAEIERVEVVRGAQSSLWGSDATGSVVQVFTKRGEGTTGVGADLEGGSFGTWRGDARAYGGSRGLDYSVGVSRRHTDGAFADRLREADRFDQTAFDGAVGASLGSRAAVRTGLRVSDADGRAVGPMAYGPSDTGTGYDTRDVSWHLDASHSVGSRMTGSASVLYFRSKSLSSDTVGDPSFNVYAVLSGTPGARFPESPRLVRFLTASEFQPLAANQGQLAAGQFLASTPFGVSDFTSTSETQFRRPAFRYQADVDWAAGQRLSAGYEFERERNPLVAAFTVDDQSFFVQQQFSRGTRWFASAGLRVDDKSRYGTYVNPKVSGTAFLIAPTRGRLSSVKVSASAGRGIKNPQFGELFGGAFADGNPDLKPERARTIDAGIEATFAAERVRASATVFDNRYRDLVEFRASDPFFRLDGRADFINVAGAKAHGWEFETAVQRPMAGVTASASYTYLASEVTETVNTGVQFQPGQPLLRRPKHSGSIRGAYTRGRATAYGSIRVVGERHDSSFLFLSTVAGPAVRGGITTDITVNPGYTVGALGVDVRAQRGLTMFVRVDNVGDAEYESVLGYPGLPRAAMAGVRWNLAFSR